MDYQELLQEYFWNNIEKEDIILDGKTTSPIEEVIKLLTVEETQLKEQMKSRPELKEILQGKERILVLETENSEQEQLELSESSDEEIHHIRMERGSGSSLTGPERQPDRGKRPRTEEENSSTSGTTRNGRIPTFAKSNNGAGLFTLNVDCLPVRERKPLIDKWASEISLTIQTNKESFAEPTVVLLLADHKTEGIANAIIKNTHWVTEGINTFELIDPITLALCNAHRRDRRRCFWKTGKEIPSPYSYLF